MLFEVGDTQKECHMVTEAETGVCRCQPRNAKDCWPHHQKLGRATSLVVQWLRIHFAMQETPV